MLAIGFGITFDVENLSYAVLDQDQSRESRMLEDGFANSRYFAQRPPISDLGDLDQRMLEGRIAAALVIPPDFGRDLLAGRGAELGVWLDGSNTIRAETARGYVQGVVETQLADMMLRETGVAPDMTLAGLVEPRFRYNQAFRSQYAIPPGVLMLLLMMIPAMLGTAETLLADNGYFSAANVTACAQAEIAPLIAIGREHHHPSWRERFAQPAPPPGKSLSDSNGPTPLEAMRHRLATPEGKRLYGLRKHTPEPVFGIIKSVMGFRQFSLRGLEKIKGEWNLVTLAWNIKRMFALASP